jgi:hypothetical protein
MVNGETHVVGEQPALKLEMQQSEIFASYNRYARSSDFVAESETEQRSGLVSKVRENFSLQRSKLSQRATMYAMNYKSKKVQKNRSSKAVMKDGGLLRRSLTHQKIMLQHTATHQKFKTAASNLKAAASNFKEKASDVKAAGKAAASSAFKSRAF